MATILEQTQAVVLCGGLGTRIRSELGETPKVLASVGEHAFLDIIVDYLEGAGLRDIVLCTGYKADEVQEHYRKRSGDARLVFSQEEKPLGTGGAVKFAQQHIKTNKFFALNGDSFCPADLKSVYDFHIEKQSLATIVVSRVEDNSDYGLIQLDVDGNISAFEEKKSANSAGYVNAGIYCFDKEIFSHMPEGEKFSIEKDFFPRLVGNRFFGFVADQEFFDIGTPERYQRAKDHLTKHN